MAGSERCPARTDKRECYLIEHPGTPVHVDLSQGWLQPWVMPPIEDWENRPTVPVDPLQDAPEALRARKDR